MKKKILYSFFALMFCLPMLFLVSACGGVTVESVELDTSCAKTEFLKGEDFSATGLVVNVKYSDGKETVVDNYEIDSSKFNKNVAGSYVIYISYEDVKKSYSVSVVEDYIVDFSVKTIREKFFIGQDFKTNAIVTVEYESGEVEIVDNYTISGFDSSAEVSGQEVTVNYGGIAVKIDVDVLSNDNYFTFVKNELQKHIISSNNCDYPYSDTKPTAELDFELDNAAVYINDEISAANDGNIWYHTNGESVYWYDLSNNVLYTKNGDTATKRTFDSAWDACAEIKSVVYTTSAEYYLGFNADNDAAYAALALTTITSMETVKDISFKDNVLTITSLAPGSERTEWSVSINYEDFTIIEFSPVSNMKYVYNQEVTVPAIPDIEWTQA